ncbi:MAG: efflux RND transporter periplasmic adaptor subunit [Gammaproteobacteria bacterium]|nr:efflux RND transporter periplasmic adaptor subunit [Gammaproteobacteria bacterium]
MVKWLLVALILGALGIFLLRENDPADAAARPARPPVPVTVFQLEPSAFQSRINALGSLRAWESVDITSSVAETVVSLFFEDGDRVERGQLLVTLRQDEEQASLREQEEVLAEQEREVARLEDLASRNQVALTELDQRRTLVAIARNKIAQMKARIEDRNINAPFSGQLGLRQVSPGALVAPGQVITTLDDNTRMRLDFTVPAVSLQFLQVGQRIEANSAAYDRSFTGTVSAIDSRVDPVSRSLTARASFPNQAGLLKPGLLMTVVLLAQERVSLLVPEEALISRASEHFVWRLDEDRAQRVPVTIGGRKPGWVEITEGLAAGDQVVRDGVARLRGTEATIRRVEG